MSYSKHPSTDAQRHYAPIWAHAEAMQQAEAWHDQNTLKHAQATLDAIKAIDKAGVTAGVLQAIFGALLNKVVESHGLSEEARESAAGYLADAEGDMGDFAKKWIQGNAE